MGEQNFHINLDQIDEIKKLNLNGYLDAHTAPILEDEIEKAVSAGSKYLLVDFENLDYISSAGLGVFMAFIEELRENGGDIKMCAMKPKVFSVFDLLGFPILFDIENTSMDAMSKFKNLFDKNDDGK
jgi:anti-sigma B factor antagonist